MGATALGFVWEISANLLLLLKLGSTVRVLSALKQTPHTNLIEPFFCQMPQ